MPSERQPRKVSSSLPSNRVRHPAVGLGSLALAPPPIPRAIHRAPARSAVLPSILLCIFLSCAKFAFQCLLLKKLSTYPAPPRARTCPGRAVESRVSCRAPRFGMPPSAVTPHRVRRRKSEAVLPCRGTPVQNGGLHSRSRRRQPRSPPPASTPLPHFASRPDPRRSRRAPRVKKTDSVRC